MTERTHDEQIASFQLPYRCPMGCGRTLYIGSGQRITCSLATCPDPAAADSLLEYESDRAYPRA